MTDQSSADETESASTWTVGSLADEAVQLLAAAKRWAEQQQIQQGEPVADVSHGDGETSCRYCPVCQLISVVRTSHPDILEQLVQGAEGAVAAIRANIVSQEKQWEARPEPRIQRIDIDVAD